MNNLTEVESEESKMTRILRDVAAFVAVGAFSVMVGIWSEVIGFLL